MVRPGPHRYSQQLKGRLALTPDDFALIIGGMKCGTTSLYELLAQHPQVAASRVKEPDYFTRPGAPADFHEYRQLWDWDPDRHQVALEASTAYAKHPWVEGVPETIARAPGRYRFIYMVRDPVARIQSQVRHGVYDGWGKTLDEELTEDLIDFSRYAAQLDRYTAHFPREDILILTLEELKQEPEAVLHRACVFLGIDPDHPFAGAEEPRNVGGLYTAPRVITALARNPALKWIANRILPSPARHRVRSWLARSGGRDDDNRGRWRLNAAEIEGVREALKVDMERLRDHYGVEASWLPERTVGSGS